MRYRSLHAVCRRGGKDALAGHGLESTVVHAKTGEPLSHNRVLTQHPVTDDPVVDIAQAGRGRWKIDTENPHGLNTKGDHIEQNFGHGKTSLAAFLLRLNLLAFLFHTVLQWCDDTEALLRQGLARRQPFGEDMRAVTRSMVFESWHHLLDCMIRGLALASTLEPQLDTS